MIKIPKLDWLLYSRGVRMLRAVNGTVWYQITWSNHPAWSTKPDRQMGVFNFPVNMEPDVEYFSTDNIKKYEKYIAAEHERLKSEGYEEL